MSVSFDDEWSVMTDVQRQSHGRGRTAVLVAAMLTVLHANAIESIGRYSVEPAGPTVGQRDLLALPVSPRFPDSVRTVGQAAEVTLMTTGYRLSSPLTAEPARAAVLALPLPVAHREFSNTPVRRVLETLVGPAFKLMEDPVHRLVSFERCGQSTATEP